VNALDWLVVGTYAAFVVTLGLLAGRGKRTAEGHLRAERSLPAWAVVFSILATEISAATYIGVPEMGYSGDWTYLQTTFGYLIGKLLLATFFIGLYWRLNLTSVYGLLGARIGPRTQRATAWAFLGGRLVASGVRLYIGAVAMSAATGLGLELAIVAMAACSIAYTWIGGLKAVVWTDVAQGSIFVIGAVTALAFGLSAIDVPLGELAREAFDAGKLRAFTLDDGGRSWLATQQPWPVAALFGATLVLASHGTDQENVQHLLNTKSAKSSTWSIALSALFAFPVVATFLAVGTMLWLYHRHVPFSGYSLANTKEIFPNFIVHALPTGLRGLVFAGLFATSIAHLGAMLNAASTIWIADIAPPRAGEHASLGRVRRLMVVFGVALLGVALFFAWWQTIDEKQLIPLALQAMTIFYGGILGAFLVALLAKRRGSDRSTVLGLCAGIAIGALGFFQTRLFGWPSPKLDWAYTIPLAALATFAIAACGKRVEPSRAHAPESRGV
jgi:SSS family transporter